MWAIGEVKKRGWSKVKLYFWPALVVSVIATLFAGNITAIERQAESMHLNESGLVLAMVGTALLVICVIMLILKVFVGNPLAVGGCRYFMESRMSGKSVGIGRTAWVFGSGYYLNVVKIMFLKDLYNALWYLLLVIPGVVKTYEYTMIPYILSENPDADTKDVFALTKTMMSGDKFQYFCLQLSFIGWEMLVAVGYLLIGGMLLQLLPELVAILLGSVILYLVNPYILAASAEVYACVRGKTADFPLNGYGASEAENLCPEVSENSGGDGDEDGDDRDYFR